jgi:hypothetical protein
MNTLSIKILLSILCFSSFLGAGLFFRKEPKYTFIKAGVINTPKEAFQLIVSAHTAAFSKDNLLTQNITKKDRQVWENTLLLVRDYLQRNTSNKDLMKLYSTVERISKDLIDTLQATYKTLVAPAIVKQARVKGIEVPFFGGVRVKERELVYSPQTPQEKERDKKDILFLATKIDPTKVDIDAIEQRIKTLQPTSKALARLQEFVKDLKAESDSERNAKSVIERLAFFLENTIDKLFIDLERLKNFKLLYSQILQPSPTDGKS